MVKLKPRVVVPMHFKTGKAGTRFAEVDEFLADKANVRRLDSSEFEVNNENLPAVTQIVVLEHAL